MIGTLFNAIFTSYHAEQGRLVVKWFGFLPVRRFGLEDAHIDGKRGFPFGKVVLTKPGGDEFVCTGLAFPFSLEEKLEKEKKYLNKRETSKNEINSENFDKVQKKEVIASGRLLNINLGFLNEEELMLISMSISSFHQRYIQISDGNHGNPSAKSPQYQIGDKIYRGDRMSEISHGYGSKDEKQNPYILCPVNGIVVNKTTSSTDIYTGRPNLISIDIDVNETLHDQNYYKDYMLSEVFEKGRKNKEKDWHLGPAYKIINWLWIIALISVPIIGIIYFLR